MRFEVFKHTYFFLSLLRNNWRKPVFEGGPAFPWPRPQISLQKHPFLLALRRWGVSSPAAKSEEKRMFSQANLRCLIKFTILPKDLAFLLQKCQHCSPIAPFHFHCFDDNHIFPLAVFVLGLFPSTPFVSTHYSSSGSKDLKDFLFPPSTPLSEKYYYFWTPLAQTSMHPQIALEIETIYNSIPTFLREIVILDHC